MFEQCRDHIQITARDGTSLVYHQRTYAFLLFGVLTHYLRWSPERAERHVAERMENEIPPTSVDAVGNSHDGVYHQAMLLAYGEGYWWEDNGYNSAEPADFDAWWCRYTAQHGLEGDFIEFL